ncbi:MAG: IclR family transcriptional regulator [Patescibacteria group bacterium]|nr:IclR family transcriptional regulator [Patescibacteria group bacterium]
MSKAKSSKEPTSTERYHVPNLDRALMILELLATCPHGAGMSDIARELTLPKNSVFRIVSTLYAHGYLIREGDEKTYRLSRKLLSLGYAAVDEHNLVETSLDVMRAIRDEVEETTLIGLLVGNQGVVVEQVPSNQPVKVLVRIGHHFPLHTAAPGKALMASLPEVELEALLPQLNLTKFNENTITSRKALREELTEARRLGYAVDRGEEMDDLHCVAAPILNHRGYPLAAIWITGPASRVHLDDFPRIGTLLRAKTATVSRRFGYGLLDCGG